MKRPFFRKSPKIKYLGRSGLTYKGIHSSYFIDSEMLAGEKDIVIFWQAIKYDDEKVEILSQNQKIEIALEVKKELESEGLSVEIHPAPHTIR